MILREKDRLALYSIFSEIEIPIEVWAYGSRVNGDAHEGSDLDLVIRRIDLAPMPIDLLMALKHNIYNSQIPILVELFDWSRIPESFKKNIEAKHEVLFSNYCKTQNIPQQAV